MKEKEQKQKEEQLAAQKLLQEQEEEEIKRIRAATIFKATPIKHYSMGTAC